MMLKFLKKIAKSNILNDLKFVLLSIGTLDVIYNTAGYIKSSMIGKIAFLAVGALCICEVVRSIIALSRDDIDIRPDEDEDW